MTSAFGVLWKYGKRDAGRAFRLAGWAQYFVAGLYAVLLLGLAVGFYLGFRRWFADILFNDPLTGPLIIRYVLEAAFAMVFLLGVANFTVAAAGTIFTAERHRFLNALPIESGTLYAHRFSAVALISAWPILLVALPALAALGRVQSAGWDYAFFALVAVLLMMAAVAVTGALLSFLLAPLLRRLSAVWLAILELLGFVALAFGLISRIIPRRLIRLFDIGPEQLADTAKRIENIFSWWPTHRAARAASSVLPWPLPLQPAVDLAVTAAVLVLAAVTLAWIVRRYYLRVMQDASTTVFLARPEDAPGLPRPPFPRFWRFRHGFLFEKDWLQFVRNPEDISRAGFLAFTLALYALAARGLSRMELFDRLDQQATIIAFAFTAIGYLALTAAIRFAFPAPSLEARRAWIIGASPVHAHEIFSWQLFFWGGLIAAVSGGIAILTAYLLGFEMTLAAFFVLSATVAAVTVTAVSLGQGAIFPDRQRREPDEMSTSPAGLSAIVVSACYLWVTARYVQEFSYALLNSRRLDPSAVIGILVLSLAIVGGYWAWAVRAV